MSRQIKFSSLSVKLFSIVLLSILFGRSTRIQNSAEREPVHVGVQLL